MEREIILLDGRRVIAPPKPPERLAISHSVYPIHSLNLNEWMNYVVFDRKKNDECPTRKYDHR